VIHLIPGAGLEDGQQVWRDHSPERMSGEGPRGDPQETEHGANDKEEPGHGQAVLAGRSAQ
jgi:hypothetical protein